MRGKWFSSKEMKEEIWGEYMGMEPDLWMQGLPRPASLCCTHGHNLHRDLHVGVFQARGHHGGRLGISPWGSFVDVCSSDLYLASTI